jgi:hypothetical protein
MTTHSLHPQPLLRNALLADAVLCGVCGLLCLALNAPIAIFLGITDTAIVGLLPADLFLSGLGVLLIATAGFIVWLLTRPSLDPRLAWFVVGANLSWILFSWFVLLTNLLNLSTGGSWLVLLLADVVLVIMLTEIYALRKTPPTKA